MEVYVDKLFPAETKKVLDHTKCDRIGCEKKVEREPFYTINEFTLEWRVGNGYPEGGCGTEYEVHLCFQCREEFKQFVKSFSRINEKEYDW